MSSPPQELATISQGEAMQGVLENDVDTEPISSLNRNGPLEDTATPTKKRKENPVSEAESMEEAGETAPRRTKLPRLASQPSPVGTAESPLSSREEAKKRREEEKLAKEKEKLAKQAKREQEEAEKLQRQQERASKRAAAEEAKNKKDEEKRAKEAAKEAEKAAKEAEKATKEAEKAAKEEERQRQKEQREEEKRQKEKQKEEAQRQKDEERKAKEDEKKAKEAEKKAKEEERRLEAEKSQTLVKRQSTALMSFFKKTPSKPSNSASSSDAKEGQASTSEFDPVSQFQAVGMFLSWVPPPNAALPRLQKWTSRASEQEFESAVCASASSAHTTSEQECAAQFRAWIASRPRGVLLSTLIERRKAKFQHRPEFLSECSATMEKQKAHVLKNKVKLLHIDESFRPTFFGTFSTTDSRVTGRSFLSKSNGVKYDLDSEDESFDLGDEEEDAVDLEEGSNGTDEEDGEEEGETNEYEFDEGFLVPDGHLSDGEANDEESEDESGDEDQRVDKAILLAQTKRKLNAKTPKLTQLMPVLTGIIPNPESLQSTDRQLYETLMLHSVRPLTSQPGAISVTAPPASLPSSKDGKSGSNGPKKSKGTIPPELMSAVALHIHKEHQKSFEKLLASLRATFTQANKKHLTLFIQEKCEKVRTAASKGGVWLVKNALRAELGLGDLPLTSPPSSGPHPAANPIDFSKLSVNPSNPSSATDTSATSSQTASHSGDPKPDASSTHTPQNNGGNVSNTISS